MKVLFCTTVLPSQRRTGGEVASQAFIDAIRAAGHDVIVLGYRRPEDRTPLAAGENEVGQRPIESDRAGSAAYAWLGRALVRGAPYSCEKYRSAAYAERVSKLVGEGQIDVAIIDHAQVGPLHRCIPPSLPLIAIAHNSEGMMYGEQAGEADGAVKRAVLRREARLLEHLERELARRACQVWTLTQSDRAYFQGLSGSRRMQSFDVPGTAMAPSAGEASGPAGQWDIGLLGTWTWEANAKGLRWFADRVVPRLSGRLSIGIAGKGAEFVHGRNGCVTALGFVSDAMEFLRSCRVVCVPSVAGGGVQIKTLDAIAAGRPLVATSFALRGISDPPRTVVAADDPADFALALESELAKAGGSVDQGAMDWANARTRSFFASVAGMLRSLDGSCGEGGRIG